MKIQAINTNTTFKGKFTDKTAENGGNWRMEYSPYCWESNNTSKMANKKQIDVFASKLPDNEEIFTKNENLFHIESSKDIFGTESYYVDKNKKMRRTITEVPAMNREDSLKVLDKKLGKFLEMKNNEALAKMNKINQHESQISYGFSTYNTYTKEFRDAFLARNTTRNGMDRGFDIVYEEAGKVIDCARESKKLADSITDVKAQQVEVRKEAEFLGYLRKIGNLIDISRRDIPNPNAPLEEALKGSNNMNKFVALPHKTVSFEYLKGLLGNEAPAKMIKIVEDMIKKVI